MKTNMLNAVKEIARDLTSVNAEASRLPYAAAKSAGLLSARAMLARRLDRVRNVLALRYQTYTW